MTTQLKATRFKIIKRYYAIMTVRNLSIILNRILMILRLIRYKWQLEQWTMNPLDVIISSIRIVCILCFIAKQNLDEPKYYNVLIILDQQTT